MNQPSLSELFQLIPESTLRELGFDAPRLGAWCCWGQVSSGDGGESATGTAGLIIGHLVGGAIGGEIGKAVGRAAAVAHSGGFDGSFSPDTTVYDARLGYVFLTPSVAALVDCEYTVSVTERGPVRQHINRYFSERGGQRQRITIAYVPLKRTRASLRENGTTLQLFGPGGEAWSLKIAKIPDAPDASQFVREIHELPVVPSPDAFIDMAVKAEPSSVVMEAMALDGSIDQVLRRLPTLDHARLAPFLANVSTSSSSSFAVWIEAWLTERAAPAGSAQIGWIVTASVAFACAVYAIVQPRTHWIEVRWIAIVIAAIGLGVALVLRRKAEHAAWFAGQLDRFREARRRPR